VKNIRKFFRRKLQRQRLYVQIIKFFATNIFFHLKLVRHFKKIVCSYNGLIDSKVNYLYFKSFISTKFNVEQKLEIMSHHYSFLKKLFDDKMLEELFTTGITCWRVQKEENNSCVSLHASTFDLREGCLRLNFRNNETDIFNLTFTIVPGELLNICDTSVIYVSRVQYAREQHKRISKITKLSGYITPLTIVLYVLEGISKALRIQSIVGISTEQHIKFIDAWNERLFDKNYSSLWQKMNANEMQNGNFYMPCPLPKRPLMLLKQKYRSVILNKRNNLREVSDKSYQTVKARIQI
jgi:uncharacterized protein VirK/YbjX